MASVLVDTARTLFAHMPELPEVEFAVRRLRRAVRGKRIDSVRVHHRSQRRTLTAVVLRRLAGRRITDVTRRGKHQLLHLEDGATLIVHFRLDGDWEVTRAAVALPRHARVTFDLEGGRRLSLTDPRALCTVHYHAPGHAPTLDLGPEPEDPALTPALFRARLQRKRSPIKPSLLDQRLVAGVGNIYAQEACWRARISPAALAAALSAARVTRLLDALRAALGDGHENAGRYHRGEQRIPFKVYDREGEPCDRCGAPIRRMLQAGRGTWYCAKCQRM